MYKMYNQETGTRLETERSPSSNKDDAAYLDSLITPLQHD
jgi:hypothetical protein